MAKQTIIWTALPNGTTSGGKVLRLSVAVSPRLSAASPNVTLSAFPDFLDWPPARLAFRVKLGKLPPLGVAPLPGQRPELWRAIFKPSTRVRSYDWKEVWIDPSTRRLRSYPVAKLRAFLAGMYSSVAARSALEWPSVELLARSGLADFPSSAPRRGETVPGPDIAEVLSGLEDRYDRRAGAIPPGARTTPAEDIALAASFLAPFPRLLPAGYRAGNLPRGKGTYSPLQHEGARLGDEHRGRRPPPSVTVPAFEFHQALSLLAEHPPLARMLGLVFDLELARPAGLPASYEVSVEAVWHPKLKTADVSPATMTRGSAFRPLERQVGAELSGGYLRLGSPEYSVVELDVDGATLKALNLAEGIRNAYTLSSADTPRSYAVPSLRSAGLSLARDGNAFRLGASLLAANEVNSQLGSSPPPTLYAEDVTRGYRVDVWDDRSSSWHTLCAREASRATGGYLVGSPPVVVPVPAGDEGWVQLGATSAPSAGQPPQVPSGDLNVPGTLFRWPGWSLVAPRPGAHLPDNSSSALSRTEQGSLAPGLPVSISYAATPSSLPTLRFGRRYRFQARAVDLAGNSVGLRSGAPPSPALSTPAVEYLRFEPVASPLMLFTAPKTPGEHAELLVVRSNYDVADSDPSITPCERHVVPPPVAEEMAEAHGRLDGPDGRPDPAAYALLSARASATYNDQQVITATGGKPDPEVVGQFYFPKAELPVVYLPDPLARGAAFAGLPDAPVGLKPLQVPFYAKGEGWPDARSFRLVLRPGVGSPDLPSATNSHALSVFLPKGTIQTVHLSCYMEPSDVAVMGLWSWLEQVPMSGPERGRLFELVAWGRHWMFTPFREILLVHAVRQPLEAPHFGHLSVTRGLGASYATISDPKVTVDFKSSARLDVLASWQEPFDDGTSPGGSVELSGRSRVGELHLPYSPSLHEVSISSMRQDFGDTKHRKVYYEAVATTRFLEYFAETKPVVLPGQAPVLVNPSGFVPGATYVTAKRASLVVRGSELTTVVYREGADYTLDDSAGTITRLPGGSIAPGEEVDVRFVAPPVTRTSLETPNAPATKAGYAVSVPSSARPTSPDVRYILPAFAWSSGTDASGNHYSRRSGRLLRVYLGRPWWSSGEGELLGVVLRTHLDVGIEAQLSPLFSRVGADPLWVTGSVGEALSLGQFPLAVASASGIVLAEQYTERDGMADIAGHEVSFDPVHGLWFCDIEIDVPPSYWPFVRLGLVRYQPASLHTAEVSQVVQTDFAQLAPDRLATLSFPSPDTVTVTVSGPGITALPGENFPVSMRVFVEVQRPGVSDPDLAWELANPDLTSGTALQLQSSGTTVVWQGSVKLPAPRGSQAMRLRLQEAELLPLSSSAFAAAVELGERVTYIDTLAI
jgi:hypothetical protein